ncbi:LysR substrate-binding domain-containing protein [Streptosporangium sp. NPDC006930]|uniref:LysR substrate-binding domain-containing protein n=1 Tax=unclassified Streptosporangium TaxID=2632669 RepID=UPI00342566D2
MPATLSSPVPLSGPAAGVLPVLAQGNLPGPASGVLSPPGPAAGSLFPPATRRGCAGPWTIAYRDAVDLTRHLRHFLVVAEELHFGRAAEVLGIAQPPLSQSIQRLERELGAELFDRSRRQIELTMAGRLLVGEAGRFLAGEERLRTMMRQAADGELGTLRVGVPPEIPAVTLHALLGLLGEEAPGLHLELHELTTPEQLRGLASARLDAGLVHHPVEIPGLRSGPVVELPLGVVLPRTSPLVLARPGSRPEPEQDPWPQQDPGSAFGSRPEAGSEARSKPDPRPGSQPESRRPRGRPWEIALADLAGHDLVVFPRETSPAWYDRMLDVCRAGGFSPVRLRHARNPEFLLGLVLAGQGVAFEQEAIARREPRLVWRPLAGNPLTRGIRVAWPERSAHPAAARFAALAAEVLTRDAAGTPRAVPGTSPSPTPRPWSVIYTP